MKFLFLFIALATFSQAFASDFSHYWSGIRRQKMLFSCHSFVAVGLVEALYAEMYKQQIDLSEGEVFGRHFFKSEEEGLGFLHQEYARARFVGDTEFAVKQRGLVDKNLEIIMQNGAKTEAELPYINVSQIIARMDTDLKAIKKTQMQNPSYYPAAEWQKLLNAFGANIKSIFQPSAMSQHIQQFLSGYRIWKMPFFHDFNQRKQAFLSYLSCRPMAISFPVSLFRPQASGYHVVIARGVDATGTRLLVRDSANIAGNTSVDLNSMIAAADGFEMLVENELSEPRSHCQ